MEQAPITALKDWYGMAKSKHSKPSQFRPDRLRDLIEARGFTQTELAEKVGVDPSQISRWLDSINTPSSKNANRLAEALQVSSDFLMGRVDDNVAYYQTPELSPDEWELIRSIRTGDFARALRTVADEVDKRQDKSPDNGSK